MTPEELIVYLEDAGWKETDPDLLYCWQDSVVGDLVCKSTAYQRQKRRDHWLKGEKNYAIIGRTSTGK